MKPKLHAAAGTLALMVIAAFWASTVLTELLGSHAQIAALKVGILWAMLILIPAMAVTGATGSSLGKGWRLPEISGKSRRMKIIAANGLLVLIPCAAFLAWRAANQQFDTVFYGVQAVELIAGPVNMVLLVANFRDGLALANRRR